MKFILFVLTFLVLLIVGVVSKEKTFTRKFAVGVDILFATLLWSSYDVTISSRAGIAVRAKAAKQPYSKLLVLLAYLLNKVEPNHVELAIEADIERMGSAMKYLGVPFVIGPLNAAVPPPPAVAVAPAPTTPA